MPYQLFTLAKNFDLAQYVAKKLDKPLHIADVKQFADTEQEIKFPELPSLPNKTGVLIQSTYPPVNDHLVEVALASFGIKTLGAKNILGVIPYFGYSRHDKNVFKQKPGPVQVVIRMLEAAGITKFVTVQLHNPLIIPYFQVSVIDILLNDFFANLIKTHIPDWQNACIIAPDEGAREMIQDIANKVGCGYLVFSKERFAADKTKIIGVEGTCTSKTAIIIDDIIDTGGTAVNVANELKTQGFDRIFGFFAHPVLSADAPERIEKSAFEKIFVSNTIPLDGKKTSKIDQFDISSLVAESVQRMF